MDTQLTKATEALRKSLTQIELLKQQNHALRSRMSAPVAAVGMGCRFPGGVCSPEGVWVVVVGGGGGVSGFPVDRGWEVEGLFGPGPDAVGKSYTRFGGLLEDA